MNIADHNEIGDAAGIDAAVLVTTRQRRQRENDSERDAEAHSAAQ